MWSIGQIADRDGVSKPAVSKAVRAMLEARPETPHELDGRGRVRLISVADYDHYRGRHVNPAKAKAELRRETGGSAPAPLLDSSDSFDEARRQGEWLKVRRQRLEHDEEIGLLVRKDRLTEALSRVGREVQAIVNRLPNRSDDLALAVSKEGVHGARVALRTIAFDIGTAIADKLAELCDGAELTDEVLEEEAS